MGGVQLDEVEAGFTGIDRCLAEIGDDVGNFRFAQCARGRGFDTNQVAVLVTQGGSSTGR
ncbi:hypothetical protein D3C79_1079780 [compost metagenome]